jgi:hypothetical protein
MKLVGKNGKAFKEKESSAGQSWEESIDYCIDNFDKDEAKKRIKAYILGMDEMYHKRILQAAKASITQNTSSFDSELKKGMKDRANKIIKN